MTAIPRALNLGRMPGSEPPTRKNGQGPKRPGSDTGRANLPPEFAQLLAGATPADLRQLFDRLMSASPLRTTVESPSRRRTPRDAVATYRIRVDLQEAKPPIWRRLEVASDLTLDRLHIILQTAMGWTDSHLHEFVSGASATDRSAEHYRPLPSIDEGLDGIDETSVRLDELVADSGDRLFYSYDFGDDWTHTIRLEAVTPREPEQPAAVLIAGARACPPEDCGGVWGYRDLLHALSNPGPDNEDALRWLGREFDPDRFDIAEVNAQLERVDRTGRLDKLVRSSVDPGTRLGALLARLRYLPDELATALEAALRPAVEPEVSTKATMLGPYLGLLELVGDSGVRLTAAGYLPPAMVEALSELLRLDDIWIGKNNRESLTYPVLDFRESAQRLGLLRKAANTVTVTKAGQRARADADALWRHLAGALPLSLPTRGPESRASVDAGVLLLVGVAAGLTRARRLGLVIEGLNDLGWRSAPHTPLDREDVRNLLRPTDSVLETIGAIPRPAFHDRTDDGRADAAGVAFARCALAL